MEGLYYYLQINMLQLTFCLYNVSINNFNKDKKWSYKTTKNDVFKQLLQF